MSDGTPTTDGVEPHRLRCFVIGPIGNKLDPIGSDGRLAFEEALQIWEEVVQPACAQVGLEPVRADGLTRAGEITDQIFRRLRDDDVVIADLTGANANVMYELGLRHTRDLLTVQIGEYGRLPFDVSVIRTVLFSRSPNGLVNARQELVTVLETGLAGQYDPVTATRIWNERATDQLTDAHSSETQEFPSSPSNDRADDEPGFLDIVVEGEVEMDNVTVALNSIAADIEAFGALAVASTSEMSKSDEQGRGMKGRLAVAARFADSLSPIADQLAIHVGEYENSLSSVSSAQLAIIERLEQSPDEIHDALGYGMVIRRLAANSRENLESVSGLIGSIQGAARTTRVLRSPTRTMVGALERFSAANEQIDEWDRRLQALGVPVPTSDWELGDGADVARPEGDS